MDIVKAKVTGTGYPIDGHTLLLFDHGDFFGLVGAIKGDLDADKAVMQTVHQTDELYSDMSEAEFAELWDRGEYEPDGIFVIDRKNAEVLEG